MTVGQVFKSYDSEEEAIAAMEKARRRRYTVAYSEYWDRWLAWY